MDHASRGAAALSSSDFPSAISHYTAAISSNSQAVDYYIKRSTAYTRTSPADHPSALKDAETAVVLAHKRGKRELIAHAQLRRGIALFGLERWADAEQCFGWVKKLSPKETSLLIWEKKVEGKLKICETGDTRTVVTVTELPEVEVPKVEEVKKAEKKAEMTPDETSTTSGPTGREMTAEKKEEGVQTPANKIRHEWYQTPENVIVTLFARGVPKDKATVEIQRQSLAITFPLSTGSDYDLSLEPLFAPIDVASSTSKIMSTKVEFQLKKVSSGQKWPSLEGSESVKDQREDTASKESDAVKRAVLGTNSLDTAPAYPTSSKSGPKNWDKLADDLTKKPKSKDKKDGEDDGADEGIDEFEDEGDSVNGFFNKLYAGADPDTRRAMMKSYQESNGTTLSTDWSVVGKGKVETSPPEGMEAKKWGE
ncbi:MAG: SGS-domain-containing [Lasallia pustulata]|uniref:SGS-domain-containing n=1 Tax=Lasallia pustulata TaxID=136370 RepID=A0A1W5D4H5_9LECA|nr:MAG: SGS-domain-containing [Lasallia pustulata]SLM37900.1 Tetratricopeptide-like helical domain [Lasallia pustulata]